MTDGYGELPPTFSDPHSRNDTAFKSELARDPRAEIACQQAPAAITPTLRQLRAKWASTASFRISERLAADHLLHPGLECSAVVLEIVL